MAIDKKKKVGFDTLVGQLEKHGGPEADALASNIKGVRKRALRLVSGEADAERKEKTEKKRQFIIALAFKNGDMQKGLKESIGLTQGDRDKMKELGIGFNYSGDVQFNIPFDSPYIPFILPNGQSGSLAIAIDQEKGTFRYEFRKNISRGEEERKVSGIA